MATAVALMAGLAARDASATTLSASSSASALTVKIKVDTKTVTLPGQVVASGKAPPAYNQKTSLASYSNSVVLSPGLTLNATAKDITDNAVSKAATSSKISSSAVSSIGSFSATTTDNLLTVTATKIVTKANFSLTSTGLGTATGSTTFTKVTINAPLLGINNVIFAGSPTVNQVVYQNSAKTITVYLNKQTVPKISGNPTGIKVDAVDVNLKNYSLFGNTVTGDIEIGTTYAD